MTHFLTQLHSDTCTHMPIFVTVRNFHLECLLWAEFNVATVY